MINDTINDAVTMAGGKGTFLAGRYRIVRQLGQGGMGNVWLAEDTQLDGKPFAIKMLPSILVANKRAYNQLKDEALVAMKLVHPNIVQIRAFEENDGNPFLVMDYIDGQTLDDYLAEHIPEAEVLRILRTIAVALDYAHSKGVVHRDVKPGNVMIAKDGTPYVLDFGIAREIQETMTRVTGKPSSGTLLYMSPEQLMGARPTPAQDIYSFAAMTYECLKGEPPFARGQIEFQILNTPPPPLDIPTEGPSARRSGTLVASVMVGLAKKPEERPATCAAVLEGSGFNRVEHVERVEGGNVRACSPNGQQLGGSRARATTAILVTVLLMIVGGALWVRSRIGSLPVQNTATMTRTSSRPVQTSPSPGKQGDDTPTKNAAAAIRREAIFQKDRVEQISDDNGFKKEKDLLARSFAQAEEHWENARWSNAAAQFTNYVNTCTWFITQDGKRQTASAKRCAASDAKRYAMEADVVTYAPTSWKGAIVLWKRAESQFEKREFVKAADLFDEAAGQFDKCRNIANSIRERKAAVPIHDEAGTLRQRMNGISDGDGFREIKVNLARTFAQAEEHWKYSRWGDAARLYTNYVQTSRDLIKLDGEVQKKAAYKNYEEARAAKRQAEEADAQKWATEGWNTALSSWEQAEEALKKMQFSKARVDFSDAALQFSRCAKKAREQKIPIVNLTASINGVKERAHVFEGIRGNNAWTPIRVRVNTPIGEKSHFSVQCFEEEDGAIYSGIGEFSSQYGQQNLNIEMGKVQYCRKCASKLPHLKSQWERCPRCQTQIWR